MTPFTRSLRNVALTAAATASLLVLSGTASLAAGGDTAEVEVTHDCTSIKVSSTLAISNVVLQFTDGGTQRFEDLPERRTGTFAGTGDDSGEVITTAWIKSGDNKSGDGPGYGERFDFATDVCDDAPSDDAPSGDAASEDSEDGEDGGNGNKRNKQNDDTDGDTSVVGGTDADVNDVNGSDDDTDGDSDDAAAGGDGDVSAVTTAGNGGDAAAAVNAASAGTATPGPRVLGVVLERDAGTDGLRAADATDVRSAALLPNTGSNTTLPLTAALAALALGGGLLRRTSRRSA